MKFINKIKTKISISLVAFALLASSCEGWLDPKPMSFLTPENALNTYEGLRTATHMLNRDLRNLEFVTPGFGLIKPFMTELYFSDLAVSGITDAANAPIDLVALTTPSANLRGLAQGLRIGTYWDRLYKGINDANTIISRVEFATFANERQRQEVLALAYFHRAFRYYRLVHQFGDVPFIVEEITRPRYDFFSTRRDVILQHIKADLEEAAQFVSPNNHPGMVNQGAIYHLLTKVNLALGEFNDAVESASRVIDGGVHSLMEHRFGAYANNPSRNVIWDLHRPQNKALPQNREAIFIILDRHGFPGTTAASAMHTMRFMLPWWSANGAIQTPTGHNAFVDNNEVQTPFLLEFGRGIAYARGTWYSTNMIWTLDDVDLRNCRESGNWMDMEDLTYTNPAIRDHPDPEVSQWYGRNLKRGETLVRDTIREWFSWPHYKAIALDETPNRWAGGHTDWYIFRLAGTYLLRAEAHYWLGNYAAAAADINRVRVRAGARPITAAEVDMRMILDERARELFYEEPRKTELTRIAFIYAKTGKTSYLGTTYSMANFSQSNFWFDHIMHVTDFYNQSPPVISRNGLTYTIASHHVLWPIPEDEIAGNTEGRINQNWGYAGYEHNIPPIDRPN